ncbi:ECF transporter S component [Falsarthrobacter nasiphocae]|uniref:Energy-coupling factor transport system substrate-specific component n=1 Tax=Falsarthrobacter nasiphocae TaxID=189863 RepID=A0AAE3YGE1_9MICC|nr:ECF transporter S component [Falsarthrobacter nasiphocae]MDR6892292.1 energy-coupling factor transport system substrate-specific component [Falsarthrobacter nasiphocae]
MTTTRGTTSQAASARRGWTTIDIVIAALVAVFGGVFFWAWNAFYGVISGAFAAFPPMGGLVIGAWLLPGVLGALIVRKPGAAIFCEVVAAVGEALVGSQWGMAVLLSGIVQGLGAELAFAAFRYRRFTLPVAMLAGAGAGLFGTFNDAFISGYYAEWVIAWKLIYMVFGIISGALVAGLVSWLMTRGVAATGALSGLASRNAHREPAL